MINLPDTFWGVCNTSLPIRNKYLINRHLLNLIPDKNWIVRVLAYCIHPSNFHDHGQMIDPPGACVGAYNTPLHVRDKFLINTYLLNLILGKDWIVCVRRIAYAPRIPMFMEKWLICLIRVGAYAIRPYTYGSKIWFLFIGWISNPVRAGAYVIRPYRYGINTW